MYNPVVKVKKTARVSSVDKDIGKGILKSDSLSTLNRMDWTKLLRELRTSWKRSGLWVERANSSPTQRNQPKGRTSVEGRVFFCFFFFFRTQRTCDVDCPDSEIF